MHLVLLTSKYTLNKKKIMSDGLAQKLNECDSLLSMESLCDDTLIKPKENLSHVEFARPDPDNLSLLSTRTTLKAKSPAGFTAAFKRPAFEFEECFATKQDPPETSSQTEKPLLFSLSRLTGIFRCFR